MTEAYPTFCANHLLSNWDFTVRLLIFLALPYDVIKQEVYHFQGRFDCYLDERGKEFAKICLCSLLKGTKDVKELGL